MPDAEEADDTVVVAVTDEEATVVKDVDVCVATGAVNRGLGDLVWETRSMQAWPAMAPTRTCIQPGPGVTPPKLASIEPLQSKKAALPTSGAFHERMPPFKLKEVLTSPTAGELRKPSTGAFAPPFFPTAFVNCSRRPARSNKGLEKSH